MKWPTALCFVVLSASSSRGAHGFVPVSFSLSTPPSCATTSSSSSSCLYAADPLAQEGEWFAYLDEDTTGLVYYFNGATGEALWEPPTNTFPKVKLSSTQRQVSQTKREQYRAASSSTTSSTTTEAEEESGGGFFGFGGRKKEEEAVAVAEEAEEEEEEGGGFFGGLLGLNKEEEEPFVVEEVVEEPAEDGIGGFFGGLGLGRQEEPLVEEKPIVLEEEDAIGGFFGGLGLGKKEEPVVEEAPVVEDKPADPMSSFFGGLGLPKAAEEPVVEEEPVVQDKPADPMSSFFGGLGLPKQEAPVVVEEPVEDIADDKAPAVGGFLGSVFGGAKPAVDKVDNVVAPSPVVPEKKKPAPAPKPAPVIQKKKPAPKPAPAPAPVVAQKPAAGPVVRKKKPDAFPERAKKSKPVEKKIVAPVAAQNIKIDMSAYVLPHPAKARWGGEDAVFVLGRTFGVFDGVSGAEKLAGVPLYSITLAKELKAAVNAKDSFTVAELTYSLSAAAEFADKSATGASTAVVGSLTEDGSLEVLNLGDSMCMVIRDGQVVSKTSEKIHYFDCPFQLSEDSTDRPRDGTKMKTKVQPGDVILAGSDGIFDNLFEEELCDLVAQGSKGKSAALARKIVDRSRRVSLDSNAATPYATLAKRSGNPDYGSGTGGKVDDISCVVVKCN